MKVVVAHNRYSLGRSRPARTPSSTPRSPSCARPASRCCRSCAAPTRSATLPAAQKALLPLSPIYDGAAQRDLRRAARRASGRTCCTCTTRTRCSRPGWCGPRTRTACRWCRPCTTTGRSARPGCTSATATSATTAGAGRSACRRSGTPATAARARRARSWRPRWPCTGRTWRSVDRYIALTDAIADHLRDYGIPADRIVGQAERGARPGRRPAPPGDGFLFAARLVPGEGARPAAGRLAPAPRRLARAAAHRRRRRRCAPLAEAAAAERADVDYLGPAGPGRGTRGDRARPRCVVVAVDLARRAADGHPRGAGRRPAGARHGPRRHGQIWGRGLPVDARPHQPP